MIRRIRPPYKGPYSVSGAVRGYDLVAVSGGAARSAWDTVNMPDTRMSNETRARIAAAWPSILLDVAGGALIKSVLAAHNISADMLRAYRGENPALQHQWEQAREQSADAFADEALDVARDPFETVTRDAHGALLPAPLIVRRDPAHARTYIDTLKWAARTRDPRKYSDKSTVDLNVRTVDLNRIIADANARLEASRGAGRVLEQVALQAVLAPAASLEDLL